VSVRVPTILIPPLSIVKSRLDSTSPGHRQFFPSGCAPSVTSGAHSVSASLPRMQVSMRCFTWVGMACFQNATVVFVELRVQPLTTELWPKVEDLFESGSACKRCWCMYWRTGSAYRQRPSEVNKAAFYLLVKEGPPPGLLAFDGDTVVGRCQLSSRERASSTDHASYVGEVTR
jgi:hypothetical protein